MTSFKRVFTSRRPRRRLLTSTSITAFASAWLAVGMLAFAAVAPTGDARAAGTEPWITTWAATPAPRWAEELPAPFNVPEVLGDQTVRQIARVSVGGDQVRIVLSNEFGTRPVTIGSASVALSAGGSAVDQATVKQLTFGGKSSAVIPPGAPLVSDPADLPVKALSSVAVSFYLPKRTGITSVHWDGAQTTYVSDSGDKTKDPDFKAGSTAELSGSGVRAHALDHGTHAVRALRHEMLLEPQRTKGALRVDGENLLWCTIREERDRAVDSYHFVCALNLNLALQREFPLPRPPRPPGRDRPVLVFATLVRRA
jgi:hypothetical protein